VRNSKLLQGCLATPPSSASFQRCTTISQPSFKLPMLNNASNFNLWLNWNSNRLWVQLVRSSQITICWHIKCTYIYTDTHTHIFFDTHIINCVYATLRRIEKCLWRKRNVRHVVQQSVACSLFSCGRVRREERRKDRAGVTQF